MQEKCPNELKSSKTYRNDRFAFFACQTASTCNNTCTAEYINKGDVKTTQVLPVEGF